MLPFILSNAVQNSMNAGENSLIGGLISGSTLLGCHVGLAQPTYRFQRLERLIDGPARVLVQDVRVDEKPMQPKQISPSDLAAALRAAGCLHAHEVARATIEVNGQITVVLERKNRADSAEP